MYIIRKRFTFAASHCLMGLPDAHQCARLHGHNYVVWLELAAKKLDEHGFVRDFGELVPFRNYLNGVFDHRHLNDVLPDSPTAERLAEYLFHIADEMWPDQVTAVVVEETETSTAEYRP